MHHLLPRSSSSIPSIATALHGTVRTPSLFLNPIHHSRRLPHRSSPSSYQRHFPHLNPNPNRQIHTTPRLHGSPFFQLGALANSRETQWFSKASGLSPVEHSTNLELIRSSEVIPFEVRKQQLQKQHHGRRDGRRRGGLSGNTALVPNTTANTALTTSPSARPTTSTSTSTTPTLAPANGTTPILSPHSRKALALGSFILHTQTHRITRLQRLLRQSKSQSKKTHSRISAENAKLKAEMRGASAAVLLSIGVASGLVTWWAWPEGGVIRKPRMAGRVTGVISEQEGNEVAGNDNASASGNGIVDTVRRIPRARSLEPGYLGGVTSVTGLGSVPLATSSASALASNSNTNTNTNAVLPDADAPSAHSAYSVSFDRKNGLIVRQQEPHAEKKPAWSIIAKSKSMDIVLGNTDPPPATRQTTTKSQNAAILVSPGAERETQGSGQTGTATGTDTGSGWKSWFWSS